MSVVVHFCSADDEYRHPMCGHSNYRPKKPTTTTDPGQVTCQKCRAGVEFRALAPNLATATRAQLIQRIRELETALRIATAAEALQRVR